MQQAHPQAQVSLWAMDEHRVGLKPVTRRQWSKKGQRPREEVAPGYKWRYAAAFVQPQQGRSEFWLSPAMNTVVFNQMLEQFAGIVGAGAAHQVLVVLDGAGWHTSKDVVVPEGVHLVFLPAATPELQPAERLWGLLDEPLVGRAYRTIEEVDEILGQRCVKLTEQREAIRARTLFHWWPRITEEQAA